MHPGTARSLHRGAWSSWADRSAAMAATGPYRRSLMWCGGRTQRRCPRRRTASASQAPGKATQAASKSAETAASATTAVSAAVAPAANSACPRDRPRVLHRS